MATVIPDGDALGAMAIERANTAPTVTEAAAIIIRLHWATLHDFDVERESVITQVHAALNDGCTLVVFTDEHGTRIISDSDDKVQIPLLDSWFEDELRNYTFAPDRIFTPYRQVWSFAQAVAST